MTLMENVCKRLKRTVSNFFKAYLASHARDGEANRTDVQHDQHQVTTGQADRSRAQACGRALDSCRLFLHTIHRTNMLTNSLYKHVHMKVSKQRVERPTHAPPHLAATLRQGSHLLGCLRVRLRCKGVRVRERDALFRHFHN
jgi:hypothetical protein